MIEQGLIIALGDNAHGSDAAVHHIGEGEVDQAVATAEKDRTHRSVLSKIAYGHIVHIGKHETEYISHIYVHFKLPLSYISSEIIALGATTAPAEMLML